MAASATWFGKTAKSLVDGTKDFDWLNDTIKVSLHTSTFTPDEDAMDFADDLTNEVANGNGYTTGGITLGSKTITQDTANKRVELDAADIAWTSPSTFSARYAVLRKDTGVAGTSRLLGYVDFGASESCSGGAFPITWDAEGILWLPY